MNIAAEPKVFENINVDFYSGSKGHFGTVRPPRSGENLPYLYWQGCREQFHSYADQKCEPKCRDYIYHPGGNKIEEIATLVGRVEDILGLPPQDKVLFRRVNGHASFLNVVASEWWTLQMMRHQFLSCLLRIGMDWNKGSDFFQSLFKYQYFCQTTKAVVRFLDGYTFYTGQVAGWRNAFKDVDTVTNAVGAPTPNPDPWGTVARLLVRPDSDAAKAAMAAEVERKQAAAAAQAAYDASLNVMPVIRQAA
jgi:hypothetical protein